MEKIEGHILTDFPFKHNKKFSDILYYEGPILSHFKGANDTNYFYYWVDNNESVNRWIIFSTPPHKIIEYLSGWTSLKDLILNIDNNFIFSVDIDKDLGYHNTLMVSPFSLNDSYIPEEDSFFKGTIPPIYQDELRISRSVDFEKILWDYAIFLKIKPARGRHGGMVRAEDAAEFLKEITRTCKEYGYYEFYNEFKSKDKYSSPQKLLDAATQIKEKISPLIADNRKSSFAVAIVNDFIMSTGDVEIRNWEKDFIKKLKEDVIDVDYNSKDEIERINKKFSLEQRENIYEPFIKILNSEKYDLFKSNKNFQKEIPTKKVSKENHVKIFPPKPKKTLKSEGEIVVRKVIIETVKGAKITPKDIEERTLFDEVTNNFPIKITEINYGGYHFVFNAPIECEVDYTGSAYVLTYEPLNIAVMGKGKAEYLINFYKEFITSYESIGDNPELKHFFDGIVEVVKSK